MLACLPGQTSLSVSLFFFALLCMIIQSSKPVLAFCAVCFGPIFFWVIYCLSDFKIISALSEKSILGFFIDSKTN